ncbi:TetR family transcriptional regulator [Streptomyces coffeae]|uniref:TetR family transcriptional regulator n=1 Tax=Streptomyces coffeae TaxID=621382 RepID=A0ABS1NLP4_9ACTN|nr:TetR family transcriptional regulator [Streptomyces coffeae]MBL1100998.1 TetR family transcriptional regulator [Streptomyces coffeae]
MQPDSFASTSAAKPDSLEGIRRQLVDCAAEVFFRNGFKRGTTKQIADLAGVSQSLVSHYFKKGALMGEIARQVSSDFTRSLEEALAGDYAPEEQLARIMRSFMESMEINRKPFAVYWKEFRSIPEAEAEQAQALEKNYVARVSRVVATAQQQGILPPDHDPALLTEGILGMLSWSHWWYRPGLHTPQQVAAAFRDLIGCGIAERQPAESITHPLVRHSETKQQEDTFDPPGLQLAAIIQSFIRSMDVNQRPFAVYWKEFRSIPSDDAEAARARERAYVARVVGVVESAQDQGVLPPQHSPYLLAEGILGMLSWTHWWYQRDQYNYSPDQVIAAFCSLVGLADHYPAAAHSAQLRSGEQDPPQSQNPDDVQNDLTGLLEWVEERYRPVQQTATDVAATVADLVSPDSPRRWYPGIAAREWKGRRRSILDTAARVFFARGYEAGTTKEIADREGVAQPLVSQYFKKHEMMGEIAQRISIEFTISLDEALGSVRHQLSVLVYTLANSRALCDASHAEAGGQAGIQRQVLLTRMRGIIAAAREEGILPSRHDARSQAEGIMAIISYLHSMDRQDQRTADEIASTVCTLIQLDYA